MNPSINISQPHLAVLRIIANRLQDVSLLWAVTGSCSLALQGVPVVVHDLDIRTTAEDAYTFASVFQPYVIQDVTLLSTPIAESHFGLLQIGGVQVEIIGDMRHRLPDGSLEAIDDMNANKRWIKVDDLQIPVMSLQFLYQAYQLMKRVDKVALLEEWLKQS